MKKFLVFAVLCCGAIDAMADTYNCTVQDMSSWSSRYSNEFLFPTVANYNGREALVCGHRGTEGCDNGRIVVVTGTHVWKKKTITDVKVYECKTDGANAWYDIGMSKFQKCSSTDGRRLITTIGDKDIWAPGSVTAAHALSEYYISDDFCYTAHGETGAESEDAEKITCPSGSRPEITSAAKCKKDEVFECTQKKAGKCQCGKCKTKSSGGNGSGGNDGSNGGSDDDRADGYDDGDGRDNDNVSVLDKCDASVCKTELCKMCCQMQPSQTVWSPEINKCLCVNGGDFTKVGNAWICKQETFVCDATLLERAKGWKTTECKYWPNMIKRIEDLENFCNGDAPDESSFLRLYDEVKADVEKNCLQVDYSEEHAAILSASKILSDMSAGFDVTVWKDEDGKFNTARLASDSVAGVVLGTVGGLVTSNVVKKNQVENGFEDIKCVIGGQTVADWGDEFRVGGK